jgi:phosphatidylserine/phosphatidylglycerophosphate/cardiolipin synthase-like enzyme
MASREIGQRIDRLVLAPAARREAVLELIRSTQRTLLLSVFRCDDFKMLDELAATVKRGVRVRILITQRARGWREKLKDLTAVLRSFGAEVQPYDSPTMKYHAKYIIADDTRVLVTSLNFTRKCFETTCDFLVFSDDPEVASGLKNLFDADCTASPNGLAVPATQRLIIGPDDSRKRLIQLLSNATSSIRIVDHRVTDPEIVELLRQKRQQGVSVQVLGNGPMAGLICHGRMLLVDQKTAIIGSIHLSRPSLDLRREVAIVTEEPNVVSELYDYFQNLASDAANLMNLWATPPAPSLDEDDEEDE